MVSPLVVPSLSMAATDSAKAIEQYTLVFGCKLVLYESSMDGSVPEGDGTVNPNDVVVEIFFNFDLVVQVVGSASNESDTIGRSNKPFAKKKGFRTGVRPAHFPPQRTQKPLKQKEASTQELDQVEHIEPPT